MHVVCTCDLGQKPKSVSNDPSNHEVTREADSASFTKSPSPGIHHPIAKENDIYNSAPLSQCKPQNEMLYDSSNSSMVSSHPCSDDSHEKGVDMIYQPEENGGPYVSVNQASLDATGDEKLNFNGPCHFGDTDEYSDYIGSSYPLATDTTVPVHYCMPQSPQPVLVECSPLVWQDDPNSIHISGK